MLKKIIKWILMVGITITVIFHVWAIIYLIDNEEWERRHSHRFVINSALGIPYYDQSGIINNSLERMKLTIEEWMKLRCKPIYEDCDGDDAKPFFYGENKLLSKDITGDEIRHLNCLGVYVVDKYNYKSEKSMGA
jgi:hypothetical protein